MQRETERCDVTALMMELCDWRETSFIGGSILWFCWLLWQDYYTFFMCCIRTVVSELDGEDRSDIRRVKPTVRIPSKVCGWCLKIVYNFIITMLGLFLLYAIYFHPYSMRPHIEAAYIGAFNLNTTTAGSGGGNGTTTNNNLLRYSITVDVTFFNEHRIFGIRFKHLTAGLYFNGTKLGPSDDTLPRFKLHTRRHRIVYPVFRGRASNVNASVAEEFARERAAGTFTVDIKLKTTLTYIFWPEKSVYYYVYDCWLHFPPPPAVLRAGIKCGAAKGN